MLNRDLSVEVNVLMSSFWVFIILISTTHPVWGECGIPQLGGGDVMTLREVRVNAGIKKNQVGPNLRKKIPQISEEEPNKDGIFDSG